MLRFSACLLVFFVLSQVSLAQQGGIIEQGLDSQSVVNSHRFSLPPLTSPGAGFNTSYKSVNYKNRFAIIPYTNPELNFTPGAAYTYAGDINGDGKDDVIAAYDGANIADERTEDLADKTAKSLIFMGGNQTIEHDQLLYTQIRPVGDLNGDGFDDALGENHDNTFNYYFGSAEGYLKNDVSFTDSLFSSIAGFRDFNDDGYEDIISFGKFSLALQIIFGGPSINDFIGKTYSIAQPSYFMPARLNSDIVAVIRFDHQGDLIHTSTLKINPANLSMEETNTSSFSFDFNTSYHSGLRAFRTIDTNADGMEEIYLTEVKEAGSLKTSLILSASLEGYSSYEAINTFAAGPLWSPVGDIDNDGRTDYARAFDNYLQVGYGPTDLSMGITPEEPWIEFDGTEPSLVVNTSSSDPQYYRLGDFNGDGFDDFTVKTDSDETIGQRIFFGSADRTMNNFQDNSYPFNSFSPQPSHLESANMGDLNGDGVDDLVLLFNTKTEIYYGGSFKEVPDLIIPAKGDGNNNLETGDFNGDSVPDLIIVNYAITDDPAVRSGYEYELNVFLGGDNFGAEASLTIGKHDIGGEGVRVGAYDVSNIGDFNHDGFDDFSLTFFGLRKLMVFYGGESFSSTPDLVLEDFNSDFGIEGLSNAAFSFGYRMQGLGDINNDGIDDFAVSDIRRSYTVDSEQFNTGVVFLFFGSEHIRGELTSRPPDEILRLTQQQFKNFSSFGFHIDVGDFNGDGHNDILTSSVNMPSPADFRFPEEGKDGFVIYHGGPEFDNVIDQVFGLPAEVFNNTNFEQIGRNYAEMAVANDLNGDGADEIFIGSHTSGVTSTITNGVLVMGGTDISNDQIPVIQFVAPNQSTGLASWGNYINIKLRSAIGDFDGDGIQELVIQQHGDDNYRNRPIYTYPIQNPYKEDQSIDFTVNDELVYTIEAIPLLGTASSSLPVSFNVISGPASITNDQLTLSGTGTIVIEASQPGNEVYNGAPLVRRSISVEKADQAISIEAIDAKTFGDDPFSVTATTDNGLPVILSIASGPGTISDNTVTITGAGQIVITAEQAGNENYNSTSTSVTVDVSKADQAISIEVIDAKTFGDDPFSVTATADNGLPVILSIASGPGTISDNTVTITGAGQIVITAEQAGNENYNSTSTSVTVDVSKADQAISIEVIDAKTFGDDPFSVTATADNGLPLVLSITSGPGTISDNTVTITGAGQIVITAEQAGNENYNSTSTSVTVDVSKADQAITFEPLNDKTIDDAPLELSATTTSGLAIDYSVLSGPATIEANVMTLTGAPGTVEIQAEQAGNENYNPATPVTQSFEVTLVTSAEIIEIQQDVTVFPNPVVTEITLEIKNMAAHKLLAIDISDTNGMILYSIPVTRNSSGIFKIDFSNMKAGLYFLRLSFEKGVVIEKVLKQTK